LSCFFATAKSDGQNYTVRQKETLIKWFWRSVFGRRFSSDVNEKQAADIAEMRALKKDEKYSFKLPRAEVKVDFEKGNFGAGNANSKALILLLSSQDPHSFWSGAKIDLSKVLKRGSKHEFHHVFPQAFLTKQGIDRRSINVLANICFLTRSDNGAIKDKGPGEYLSRLAPEIKRKYLIEALCPPDTDAITTYHDFVRERSLILDAVAHDLMA
jgi:hypothetical protein